MVHSPGAAGRRSARRTRDARMIRLAYNTALHVGGVIAAGPVLAWAHRRRPRFREHLPERLGRITRLPRPGGPPPLWLHGVSLGEVRALHPLVVAWRAAYPARPLLVSASTETGLDAASALYRDQATITPFPLDTPAAVRAHVDHWRPACVAMLETELWPNFFWMCADRGIPVCLISGRIGPRTMRTAKLLRPLWRSVLRCGAAYAMRDSADADRLIALGAPTDRVHVLGDLKWDIAAATQASGGEWRAGWGLEEETPLVLWGSTHAPEEELALRTWQQLRVRDPRLRLCVAPRHPERFESVAQTLAVSGARVHRRSAGPTRDWDVLILDSIGELADVYAAATVVLMGGTFAPVGGHNIVEVLSAGVPCIVGPHTRHIRHLVDAATAADALLSTVEDRLLDVLGDVLHDADRRHALVANGAALLARHRGTAQRLTEFLDAQWPARLSAGPAAVVPSPRSGVPGH